MTTKIAPPRRKWTTKARELKAEETATVPCGFCQGKGLDPFGVMSALASCCVCGGSGTVSIKMPYLPCAFCGGSGVHPGSRQTCIACGGVGASSVQEPHRSCPLCLGTGRKPYSEVGFYCLSCHGTGVVENGTQPVGKRR